MANPPAPRGTRPVRKGRIAFDGHGPGQYDPKLYQPIDSVEPLPGWDALTDAHVEQYRQLGFIAIADAFDAQRVDAAHRVLDDVIADPPEDFDGLMFEAAAAERLDELTMDERFDAVRKLMRFGEHAPALSALGRDERLLAMVRRLLGDREPRMFQDMALLKGPGGREKPWHQDHAYFNLEIGQPVVGVWIALDEATVANGCMQVVPGSHRDGPVVHFQRRDWQICDTMVRADESVAAPLKPGGLLLFDGLLHHGTPHNLTKQRRRAVQFHYCAADAQWVEPNDRLAVFGEEGKDVEC